MNILCLFIIFLNFNELKAQITFKEIKKIIDGPPRLWNFEQLLENEKLKELKEHPVLVFDSLSPEKNYITKSEPRVILNDSNGFQMAFITQNTPESEVIRRTIQIAELNEENKWEFREIIFPKEESGNVEYSNPNPQKCAICHAFEGGQKAEQDLRPIISSYPMWPGLYTGFHDGRGNDSYNNYSGEQFPLKTKTIRSIVLPHNLTAVKPTFSLNKIQLLQKKEGKPPITLGLQKEHASSSDPVMTQEKSEFSFLKDIVTASIAESQSDRRLRVLSKALEENYGEAAYLGMRDGFKEEPLARWTLNTQRANYKRMSRILKEIPHYDSYKYVIIASLHGCFTNMFSKFRVNDFFPENSYFQSIQQPNIEHNFSFLGNPLTSEIQGESLSYLLSLIQPSLLIDNISMSFMNQETRTHFEKPLSLSNPDIAVEQIKILNPKLDQKNHAIIDRFTSPTTKSLPMLMDELLKNENDLALLKQFKPSTMNFSFGQDIIPINLQEPTLDISQFCQYLKEQSLANLEGKDFVLTQIKDDKKSELCPSDSSNILKNPYHDVLFITKCQGCHGEKVLFETYSKDLLIQSIQTNKMPPAQSGVNLTGEEKELLIKYIKNSQPSDQLKAH